jgi:hypothetical protein
MTASRYRQHYHQWGNLLMGWGPNHPLSCQSLFPGTEKPLFCIAIKCQRVHVWQVSCWCVLPCMHVAVAVRGKLPCSGWQAWAFTGSHDRARHKTILLQHSQETILPAKLSCWLNRTTHLPWGTDGMGKPGGQGPRSSHHSCCCYS